MLYNHTKIKKKGKIMELTNTVLFALYGGVLFTLTALAIYLSDKISKI